MSDEYNELTMEEQIEPCCGGIKKKLALSPKNKKIVSSVVVPIVIIAIVLFILYILNKKYNLIQKIKNMRMKTVSSPAL